MNKETFKKGGMRWATLVFVIVAVFAITTHIIPSPKLVQDEQGFSHIAWDGAVVTATENNTIGALVSGFLWIGFMNVSNDPAHAYDFNGTEDLETFCNASLDPDADGTTYYAYNASNAFSLTLKWGTPFSVVVRYRGNQTVAHDGSIFHNESCRVKINATGGGVTMTEVTLTNIQSKNSSDDTFIWINAYDDNGGAGYELNKGGTCTITNIKIEFNY